jgi:hypothetical protein
LRDSIGVTNDSPLRDPDLRNDWEHLDQRIEEWSAEGGPGGYVGRNIGRIETGDPKRRFGHDDPDTGEVTFWQHSASVPALIEEAQNIRRRLEVAVATP